MSRSRANTDDGDNESPRGRGARLMRTMHGISLHLNDEVGLGIFLD